MLTSRHRGLLAGALLLAMAIGVHLRLASLTWSSDLAFPDDPAHYVTGVMVFDYIRHGLWTNPLNFAAEYYVRFPKVAFGHWPPVYYAMQALAYVVGGPSIATSRVLSLLICATMASILYRRTGRISSAVGGMTAASCFLLFPQTQDASWRIASDLLVALFMVLAAFSLADFLNDWQPGQMAWFAIWSVLAVLTKGSAWSLGILAVAAPLITRRFRCFLSRWYWLGGIAAVAAGAPFYLLVSKLNVGYPANPTALALGPAPASIHILFVRPLLQALPTLFWLPVLVGVAVVVIRWTRNPQQDSTGMVMVALIASQCLFLSILPLTEEPRYYMPTLAAAAVLSGVALTLPGDGIWAALLAGAISIPTALSHPPVTHGYAGAIDSIPALPGSVTLVGSDSPGEGALIARRLDSRALDGVLLRGSKQLAQSNWNGSRYQLLATNPQQVWNVLDAVPVRYVLLDRTALDRPEVEVLRQALESAPDRFHLRGQFPVSGSRTGIVSVYENLPAAGRPAVVRDSVRGRHVEVRIP